MMFFLCFFLPPVAALRLSSVKVPPPPSSPPGRPPSVPPPSEPGCNSSSTCEGRCGFSGCDKNCDLMEDCICDRHAFCGQEKCLSIHNSGLSEFSVGCNQKYTVTWNGPGQCGIIAELTIEGHGNIGLARVDEVIVHTCGSAINHNENTLLWYGKRNHNGGSIMADGAICNQSDHHSKGPRDPYCENQRIWGGTWMADVDQYCHHYSTDLDPITEGDQYLIGVEFEEWMHHNDGETQKAQLTIECAGWKNIGNNTIPDWEYTIPDLSHSDSVEVSVRDAIEGLGDPIMADIQGNKFDIAREGHADLLVIRDGNDVLLKVQGLIKRVLPCQGVFLCKLGLFITEVTLSGSWTKKKFHFGIEKKQNEKEPSVLIDGTEAWPLSAEDSIFSELSMHVSNFSASDQGLGFNFMKTSLDIRRIVQTYAVCKNNNKVKFFNIYFRGAKELLRQGMTVGGILGNDSHEDWEKCDVSNDKSNLLENLETERNFVFAKVE